MFFDHEILATSYFCSPFTERSRLYIAPVTDENVALSNTIEEMLNAAFGNIPSTNDMDERNLRFSEFINKGEKHCQKCCANNKNLKSNVSFIELCRYSIVNHLFSLSEAYKRRENACSELELVACFIHPLCKALFASDDPMAVAHPRLDKVNSHGPATGCRSDYAVDACDADGQWYKSVSGEVKLEKAPKTLIKKTYTELLFFTKDELCNKGLKGVLGFQAVEICTLTFPREKRTALKFFKPSSSIVPSLQNL
ncbi:hypothetical protein AB4K20DRAFT_1812414 [Rhizopus microsporus]|uniref:Uncharacterized protein n=1 Tax=Rhizopus microsporus TaxID=58291 RepID=A0A1X0S315_RHIZD|nr:hypothetical protein BCV71DRAFT_285199 [Rhizopus microsporus]